MEFKTDKELLKEISAGDQGAFSTLFDRHWKPLFSFVYHLCQDEDSTKDILQDVFLYVWDHRSSLAVGDNIRPYLNTIARNSVIDSFRKDKVRLLGTDVLLADLQRVPQSDEHLLLHETQLGIDAELKKMPYNMQSCFRLSRFEDLSIREIAVKLGISEQTVKNNISEALRRLRTGIKENSVVYFALIAINTFSNN
ncbi:RNA polymerase sigma factor [Mucilaginibacter pedocola]|uniref:RNA polymerase sigma-70 factor n=1 Tax=Mucilaginibacter pedocola TaxID=1792845 RepID=A0A1S9PAD0_9SPHI|nr:sigma-70 family RNA polymerase sigma factor [Mucilaginibacter pedocola]OOQ57787.1 hypothetical protein BC343_13455 [Mucilaginibacter pedocola]